jgi:outer membrane lipoprotein-sorting protein
MRFFSAGTCAFLVFFALFFGAGHCGELDQSVAPPVERGEVLLRGGERRAALATMLEAFERHKAVRASMESLVRDELLGEDMKETGEIALLRPGRMLRRFFRPRNKLLVLSESNFQEYRSSTSTVYVKDLSKAPRTLSFLRAAMTGDLIVLETWFDLFVFRKLEQAEGPAGYRFVLIRKPMEKERLPEENRPPSVNLPDVFPYRTIIVRWAEGALFFSEMELYPVAGEKRTERYFDIREDKSLSVNDFKFDFPAGTKQEIDGIVESDQ